MKQTIGCPCESSFSVEFEEEVDIDKKSEYLEQINSGKFMNYNCLVCGKLHKPEFEITVLWKSKNLKLEVLPELERGAFYRRKKESKLKKSSLETIIGYPEMADRLAVIKDGLEPVAVEALKYYLHAKADENYPDKDITIWYNGKSPDSIEFHLHGIRRGEVAVMRVPVTVYDKTFQDWRKHPKSEVFAQLRFGSYLSVQNIFRSDLLK